MRLETCGAVRDAEGSDGERAPRDHQKNNRIEPNRAYRVNVFRVRKRVNISLRFTALTASVSLR